MDNGRKRGTPVLKSPGTPHINADMCPTETHRLSPAHDNDEMRVSGALK